METLQDKTAAGFILRLKGRLDASNATGLEQQIRHTLNSGETRLLIDLSQLDYVSSAGLRVFLIAAKLLKSAGGKFALFTLKENVKEVFDLAGFTSIFTIVPTQEDAMNLLTNGAF